MKERSVVPPHTPKAEDAPSIYRMMAVERAWKVAPSVYAVMQYVEAFLFTLAQTLL